MSHIFQSAWWLPKPGSLLTDGRLGHVYLGALIPACGGLFSYGALGWVASATLVFAVAWELLFPILRRIDPPWGGLHPFGDVIDLIAYVLGWLFGVVLALVAIAVR